MKVLIITTALSAFEGMHDQVLVTGRCKMLMQKFEFLGLAHNLLPSTIDDVCNNPILTPFTTVRIITTSVKHLTLIPTHNSALRLLSLTRIGNVPSAVGDAVPGRRQLARDLRLRV